MNNYNVVADYIVEKYINRISGKDLPNRIIGENPTEHVMTGLLAENRVEETFEGKYKENDETKFESIPSISLKFNIDQHFSSKLLIKPEGLLFYTVKPNYAEIVDYYLQIESKKNHTSYSSINELIEAFPDKQMTMPRVYKKVNIEELFSEGIEIDILKNENDEKHLKAYIDKILKEKALDISQEIRIIREDTITYNDLANEDFFKLKCSEIEEKIIPSWSFDIYYTSNVNTDSVGVYVQMVNRTEKTKGNNCGYLPQIYNAGFKVVGLEDTKFKEVSLDYFKNSYKDRKKCYSVGENTSSDFDSSNNMIYTVNVPIFYQYRTKTNDNLNTYIEFSKLIDNPVDNLTHILNELNKDLEKRKKEFDECEEVLSRQAVEKMRAALDDYEQEVKRFENGIEQIKYKDMVYKAFVMMNETFSTEVPGGKVYLGWRLFQIVFIVSLICEVIASEYKDDMSIQNCTKVETANLLYFPTGGGKTEAFLGISVFTMFFDRLRGKNEGITGILKYPLRLLAVQQLDRVLSIVMKANIVRNNSSLLKDSNEFAVGFLVGSGNTPNKVYENDTYGTASKPIREGDENILNTQYKFIDTCPICGKKQVHVEFDADLWKLKHVCGNPDCQVDNLPIYIVDNEIYRYLPSLVVSTVDKMAALGISDDFKLLLGQARYRCKKHGLAWQGKCLAKYTCDEPLESIDELKDPLPTLFIQDEMHLVKESLGTFDAHYESFLNYYAKNLAPAKQRKRINFIGATATISMYEDHIKHLYHMRGRRFPCEYPSREQGKDFYSYVDKGDITRIIAGYAPYGRSISAGMWESVYHMRLIVCDLMNSAEDYLEDLVKRGFDGDKEKLIDILYDYWIELVYNNRKEDANNLANSFSNQANDRLQDKGLTKYSSKLMTSDEDFQEVRSTLFDIKANRGNLESTNLILATSTISHGVDEDSFNNMFFYGMPNTNAEYIQAYSRSGRKYTGIVIDIIRLMRVRDRAYLKNFVLFHENKDDLVETVPINRWAKNAIYYTLPGMLSGLFLQYYPVKLNRDSLKKTKDIQDCLNDGSIEISDVIDQLINLYGCTENEKLSINYKDLIKRETYEILNNIKTGIFDNSEMITKSIKKLYRKRLEPMTSLRDTEETIEVKIME